MSARLLAAIAVLVLAGCAARGPAPIVERAPPPTPAPPPVAAPPVAEAPKPVEKPLPTHTVKRGDTLVSIALQYGLDYRELAAWNNITNLNVLAVGRRSSSRRPRDRPACDRPRRDAARVRRPADRGAPACEHADREGRAPRPEGAFLGAALAQMASPDPSGPVVAIAPPVAPPTPEVTPPPPTPAEPEKSPGTDNEDVDWMWPVKGKVLAPFTESAKGMDIGGRKGAPVLAAAGGRVVYAGGGLRGYGKLVIIKHNNTWLSAYAHNENILVKEQQDVKKGQKIAEMGSSDTDQVKLHFEVRRQGKPVDPVKILPPL
jgi:lipoprotein NlpD